MQGNLGNTAPMQGLMSPVRTATRYTVNRNWSYRGDNTKYRAKK